MHILSKDMVTCLHTFKTDDLLVLEIHSVCSFPMERPSLIQAHVELRGDAQAKQGKMAPQVHKFEQLDTCCLAAILR